MPYVLASATIRAPQSLEETNSTQLAEQRTLNGSVNRDFYGSNKRVWVLDYRNTKKTDYDTINTIYLAYLNTGTVQTWAITETNYAVASTTVHIDLLKRGFSVKGTDYLSDFTLILTEA